MHKTWRLLVPALVLFLLPAISSAQFGISLSVNVNVAPPELPVYEQPPLPAVGYIFVPGYWFWDTEVSDYVWIPGTWVPAPEPGYLWTPGYWGYEGGAYLWHGGYWGPTVGFYGGVDYGFGYTGGGYEGGYWHGGQLFYNRAVVNLGTTHVTNVYVKNVTVNNITVNRVSFNGGPGGVQARATSAQLAAANEHHLPPSSEQVKQANAARSNPDLRAKANGGHPTVAATAANRGSSKEPASSRQEAQRIRHRIPFLAACGRGRAPCPPTHPCPEHPAPAGMSPRGARCRPRRILPVAHPAPAHPAARRTPRLLHIRARSTRPRPGRRAPPRLRPTRRPRRGRQPLRRRTGAAACGTAREPRGSSIPGIG